MLDKLCDALAPNGFVWLRSKGGAPTLDIHRSLISSVKQTLAPNEWNALWSVMSNSSGGDIEQHWTPQVLGYLFNNATLTLPKVRFIVSVALRPRLEGVSAVGPGQ